MIYECLVIDNSNFFKNGTIRVRVKKEITSRIMMRDLSINPKESIDLFGNQRYEKYDENKFKYDDRDVRVMSSIGGAYDYGLFILPQPNTWGLVAEIGSYWDDHLEPRMVWIGALSMFNMVDKSIAIPSDKIYNPNGCNEGEVNLDAPYSGLTFKQKETHISNSAEDLTDESKKTLNWKERPTQNMVVMNDKQIMIYHNNLNKDNKRESFSQITINENGTKISFSDDNERVNSSLTLNNDGTFDLESEDFDNNITNSLNSETDRISLNRIDGKTNMGLSMGTGYSGEPSCSLNLKSDGDNVPTEIILNGKSGIIINSKSDISINPGENSNVTLGSGEGYVLTSNKEGTFNIDNHIFTAMKNVKA